MLDGYLLNSDSGSGEKGGVLAKPGRIDRSAAGDGTPDQLLHIQYLASRVRRTYLACRPVAGALSQRAAV